jgi:hypothetical protein
MTCLWISFNNPEMEIIAVCDSAVQKPFPSLDAEPALILFHLPWRRKREGYKERL